MSETMLSSLAAQIVLKLGSAAVQEIGSLWGLKADLQRLNDTVSTIKAVLLDAEEKQSQSHQVRNWLERLAEAVYEADDLVDEFSTEALRRRAKIRSNEMAKQVCNFFSTSNQIVFRLKLSRRVREIRTKLALISSDKSFHLDVRSDEETRILSRVREETHSFVLEDQVIGRIEDKIAIIEFLFEVEFEDNVVVIPIVGIGGLGKTTLAQCVFNDKRVQEHFELKMWVCVHEVFDLKQVIRKIIMSVTNKNPEDLEIDQLQIELRRQINGKKYLLVLDDMWNENREKWLKLKSLLTNGGEGSRIIVTTRSKMVAEITGSVKPYALAILDEEKSWLLFKRMAFRQGQEQNDSSIREIGMQIMKKCGGIPLAIRTIGSMLFFKDPEAEWPFFNEMKFSELSQKEDGDILPTLKLSYDQLPSPLKHCFAYCSLFPKGYEFDMEILITQWMAQGFLVFSNSSCMEDVGYEYFLHLLWRSFFEEVGTYEGRNAVKYKMHDLMHDLAVLVAGSECAALDLNEENIDRRTRHVSLNLNFHPSKQIPVSLVRAERIRTILLPCQDIFSTLPEGKSSCDAFTLHFKFLRTLDLCDLAIEVLPNSIGALKHLRYLDLSGNKFMALPDSITKLQNLQTLKLNSCGELQELPRGIKQLVNLRHLEISGCFRLTHMPHGLGQLTNLRKLTDFVLGEKTGCFARRSGELNELMGLNNLRGTLTITILRHGKDAFIESCVANLKEKCHLETLILNWDQKDEFNVDIDAAEVVNSEMLLEGFQPHPNLRRLIIQSYGGVRYPSWLPLHTNLVEFGLWRCMKYKYLPPFNHFGSLRALTLYSLHALEYVSDASVYDFYSSVSSTCLPSLENLWLAKLPKLKGWWRDVITCEDYTPAKQYAILSVGKNKHSLPSFPLLSTLYIRDCPLLTSMPLYPRLKDLTLENTSWKTFQQTMLSVSGPPIPTIPTNKASSSSCFVSYPLCQLRSLSIAKNDELQCLPDWFRYLNSLEMLFLTNCTNLKSLSPGIQHLISLQSLQIQGSCENFDMLNDDPMALQSLQSLHSLSFKLSPNLVVLPKKIQYITSLQQLDIGYCNNLLIIPEWIENLRSLKKLSIYSCSRLGSLPEGIRSLNSLKTLEIRCCDILLQRCKKQIGQD